MTRPQATEACELTVLYGEKVVLYCLSCERTVGEDVTYLNEALVVWAQHTEEHVNASLKFCLVPGPVRSVNDDDVHEVSAPELARLYELRPGEWRTHRFPEAHCATLRHLRPVDGVEHKYGRPE